MSYLDEYKSKLVSPQEAAGLVSSGDWVDFGMNSNIPELFDGALALRKGELSDVKIRGGLSLRPLQIVEQDPDQESFNYNSWHFSGIERRYYDKGQCSYMPMTYRNLPEYYRRWLDVDVACLAVTPMNKDGYFNLSLTVSAGSAILKKAKKVILEVDENLPWAMGGFGECIHISEVDAIIEGAHSPLPELPPAPLSDADRAVASLIVPRIRDGSTIQLGIGGMPVAIGAMIAQSDIKDLGAHTEMLCDSYLDMFEAGKLTNKRKTVDPGRAVWSLCLGTARLFRWLHENPDLCGCPVDYVNSPAVMACHDDLVAINNCVEADLFGQICSESSGVRQISGSGGQLDFVTGSFMSRGGQGFICMSSTYFDKKENRVRSRIVPTLAPGGIVTDPRSQAFYLVTEWGVQNLAGRTVWERAERIISLAHPDFREELIREANKMKIWRNSNKR
ncbi:acetyl-CoA hydrolase/transferase family protein [Bacilliculturomica massiliensis]|uniref:acetyl-CoA hydrolase/transferase family protein n=1 Tax=Bacilliculturomica massiliensis TaxID=1917867 RepID=UPI00102F39DC|nr:acetyl-CoA hydrolase/transferase C-terminal domain-containing protein [Bacilliculturomica massiliensis]